jgi:hypothetical protein
MDMQRGIGTWVPQNLYCLFSVHLGHVFVVFFSSKRKRIKRCSEIEIFTIEWI